MTTTTTPAIVSDAKTLAQGALGALKTAADSLVGKTTAEIPTLTGDSATFAVSWLEAHATGEAKTLLTTGTALFGPIVAGEAPALDAIAVAGLHDLQQTIDAKLTALGAT